jgi:hypothetical protein
MCNLKFYGLYRFLKEERYEREESDSTGESETVRRSSDVRGCKGSCANFFHLALWMSFIYGYYPFDVLNI